MLFYRPLLAAYRRESRPPLRTLLLRQLTDPRLHSEPEEILHELNRCPSFLAQENPADLAAEMFLREHLVSLKLTTRDPQRSRGGLWTQAASGRALVNWTRSQAPSPELGRAASLALKDVVDGLLKNLPSSQKCWVLSALGEFGQRANLDVLANELLNGASPWAAAVGLSRQGSEEAGSWVFETVQKRGIENCAPWLGVSLQGLVSPTTFPLVGRLARSPDAIQREQAARAIEGCHPEQIAAIIEVFEGESDPVVRTNLFESLSRLKLKGLTPKIEKLLRTEDEGIVRAAAVQAIGACQDEDSWRFLAGILSSNEPGIQAEALRVALCSGARPDDFLKYARQAVKSDHPRLTLMGLLALSVWSPEEGFEAVVGILAERPSRRWFFATYALRYLRTERTAKLLMNLWKVGQGTDLEEFVLTALCRHLEEPEVLDSLLLGYTEKMSPSLAVRMMHDMARHIPDEVALDAATELRQLLKRGLPASHINPVLVALGALGCESDLDILKEYLKTDTVSGAIHGMELLMAPEAKDALEQVSLAREAGSCESAIVALYRLGCARAMDHLAELSRDPEKRTLAIRAFVGCALSVRCVKTVSRLAHLHSLLETQLKEFTPMTDYEASTANRRQALLGRQQTVLDEVLVKVPRSSKARKTLTLGSGAVPSPGSSLYENLASYMSEVRIGPAHRLKVTIVGSCVLAILVLVLGYSPIPVERTRAEPRESHEALSSRDIDLAAREDPIRKGQTFDGNHDDPVRFRSSFKENSIILMGHMKATEFVRASTNRLNFSLGCELSSGDLKVSLGRGRSSVQVLIKGVEVSISRGHVLLTCQSDTASVKVYMGEAVMKDSSGSTSTVSAGQMATIGSDGLAPRSIPLDMSRPPWEDPQVKN